MNPPPPDARDENVEELREALGDEFEIMRALGKGSMAVVYLARERALGRLVALKVLRAGKVEDETALRRFEREAKSAASISEHPDVVAVHRYGRLPNDTPYLVMGYVKGRTMEERIKAEGRLPVEDARQTLLHVASALAAAHERGIVHRDVRPGNVLWDEEKGRGFLSDFGIAAILDTSGMESTRLTRTGQLVGDPRYLSPEQLQDQELTQQADIYGLGVLGYELLTGEGPYEARSNTDWITAHLTKQPRDLMELRPDLPRDLADLLPRCLAKEPNHRPSAADVARILQGSRAPAGAGAPAADVDGDLAELIKRRVPQIVGLALVVGVTLVGLMADLQERYALPEWVFDLTVVTAVAGLVGSTVMAWFHGEEGEQRAPSIEYIMLSAIGLGWLVVSIFVVMRG